ncbi:hypothetical protein SAMN06264941_2080 [Methanohalophilus portucalensis FDF-1]|uniref:Uncharacterized protein n=1 Tax=Methanohalophilus portucalensis FDF-1 TaxID=523843 RepID=A0A1X7P2G5_9EURY|nr:hypothetical protein SAMN06264941_2080 [Methanohalophilus portucalensis FDF-1]
MIEEPIVTMFKYYSVSKYIIHIVGEKRNFNTPILLIKKGLAVIITAVFASHTEYRKSRELEIPREQELNWFW